MLANKLMSALSGGAEDKLYVDDVFSTYTYTGNGSTQTINNGIDLAGKGGLVWNKRRGTSADTNRLFDTARGAGNVLTADSTSAQGDGWPITFNSAGHSISVVGSEAMNTTNETYVSWTFRKAPKFFDVVTYTGNGVANNTVSHSLNGVPGFFMIKKTSSSGKWLAFGRLDATNYASAYMTTNVLGTVAQASIATSSVINVGWLSVNWYGGYNDSGATYVAYLFAHDPSADGIVQCGSFTTDASGNATVNLGWEPQHIMFKRVDSTSNWFIQDSIRGWLTDTPGQQLYANLSDAEAAGGAIYPTATGLRVVSLPASSTWIYKVIRRPNKPPTLGTQVYNAIARTGTGAAATVTGVGFAPDLVIHQGRANLWSASTLWLDKLRGAGQLYSQTTGAEEATNSAFTFTMDGFSSPITDNYFQYNGSSYIEQCFKRAPGFFDVVCYTGTGVARTVPHSLGVAPELMIVKRRNVTGDEWQVYVAPLTYTQRLFLNMNGGAVAGTSIWNAAPTAAVVSVGGAIDSINLSGSTYVAYLFATKAGISKVGSYTGNGSSQTINCGFTTGARFILIKRTDSTGDWFVWDTARGIVSANDPHLSLNTTAAEVTTDDSVDPDASGFIVNQVAATNINVNAASYTYLAIS